MTISGGNFLSGASVDFCSSTGCLPATGPSVTDPGTISLTSPRNPERIDGQLRALGDVNGSGTVTSLDALCVLRAAAALPPTAGCPAAELTTAVDVVVTNQGGLSGALPGGYTFANADVNGSGAVTSLDALCVLRAAAALPSTAGCPGPAPEPAAAASQAAGAAVPLAAAAASGVAPRGMGVHESAGRYDSSPVSVRLEKSAIVAAPGGSATATLVVHVPGGTRLGAWQIDVAFDPAVASVTACTTQAGDVRVCTPQRGRIGFQGASLDGLVGTVPLGTITFQTAGAPGTAMALHVASRELVDLAGILLAGVDSAGSLIITGGTPTATATATPFLMPTPTPTAMATATLTGTATASATGIRTATSAATSAATPTITATRTPTATRTASAMPTPTRTPALVTPAAPALPGREGTVGICHATGSSRNAYVYVEVSARAEDAHRAHGDLVGVSSLAACHQAPTSPHDGREDR